MPFQEHDKNRVDQPQGERGHKSWGGPAPSHLQPSHAFGPAHRHHHGPPRSGMGGSGDDGFSGRAAQVLGPILPPAVINWLLRSVSYGPPEIIAIFKVEIAAIDADLVRRQVAGIEAPWFSPEDIQAGEDTLHAMSATMTDNEIAACLHNLFSGPDEVQAIAFLSLVVLRLNTADPNARAGDQQIEV